MNKNQLKQFIIAKIYGEQGFSVNVKGTGTRNGYMVGFNCAELVELTEDIKPSQIDQWVEDNYLTLAEDKNLYAGGWEDNGRYYLEISRNIGIRQAAIDLANKHNQLAIYDCENDKVITLNRLDTMFNSPIAQLNDIFGHFNKIFTVLLFVLLSMGMSAQTTVTLKDGVYTVQTKEKTFKTPKDTGKIFQDSKGTRYPILQSESGAYFIIRTSAKTQKSYKQYLKI